MCETNELMSQEDLERAALNSNALPKDVRIIDVEYPVIGKIESGQTEIAFYKAGYTDKALVHIQDGETYLSFLIEPFLTQVKFFEIYASFDDWFGLVGSESGLYTRKLRLQTAGEKETAANDQQQASSNQREETSIRLYPAWGDGRHGHYGNRPGQRISNALPNIDNELR